MRDMLLVAVGGAIGAVARFGVYGLLPRLDFPWATLVVNVAGSFAIGYLFLDHGMDSGPRLLVAVGFLGAFTTLSTFSAEVVDLWRHQHHAHALLSIGANGVGGPLAALAGWKLSQAL